MMAMIQCNEWWERHALGAVLRQAQEKIRTELIARDNADARDVERQSADPRSNVDLHVAFRLMEHVASGVEECEVVASFDAPEIGSMREIVMLQCGREFRLAVSESSNELVVAAYMAASQEIDDMDASVKDLLKRVYKTCLGYKYMG